MATVDRKSYNYTSKINTFNQIHGISDHKELVDFSFLMQPINNVNIFTLILNTVQIVLSEHQINQ